MRIPQPAPSSPGWHARIMARFLRCLESVPRRAQSGFPPSHPHVFTHTTSRRARISIPGAAMLTQHAATTRYCKDSAWRTVNTGSNPVGATIGGGPRAGRQQPAEGAVAGERVAARAGDEHGRALDAIREERLEGLARVLWLT